MLILELSILMCMIIEHMYLEDVLDILDIKHVVQLELASDTYLDLCESLFLCVVYWQINSLYISPLS